MSSQDNHSNSHKGKKHKKNQRRPGRDTADMSSEVDHDGNEMAQEVSREESQRESSSNAHSSNVNDSQHHQDQSDRRKVHIEFYGSELLKQKAPQAFDFAETVAEEWVNNGRFDSIPVESPLAKAFTVYGLRKAKKIEKKLEQSGVFALVKTGIDYAQSKLRR